MLSLADSVLAEECFRKLHALFSFVEVGDVSLFEEKEELRIEDNESALLSRRLFDSPGPSWAYPSDVLKGVLAYDYWNSMTSTLQSICSSKTISAPRLLSQATPSFDRILIADRVYTEYSYTYFVLVLSALSPIADVFREHYLKPMKLTYSAFAVNSIARSIDNEMFHNPMDVFEPLVTCVKIATSYCELLEEKVQGAAAQIAEHRKNRKDGISVARGESGVVTLPAIKKCDHNVVVRVAHPDGRVWKIRVDSDDFSNDDIRAALEKSSHAAISEAYTLLNLKDKELVPDFKYNASRMYITARDGNAFDVGICKFNGITWAFDNLLDGVYIVRESVSNLANYPGGVANLKSIAVEVEINGQVVFKRSIGLRSRTSGVLRGDVVKATIKAPRLIEKRVLRLLRVESSKNAISSLRVSMKVSEVLKVRVRDQMHVI